MTRIQTGAKEPIEALIVDSTQQPLTGLSDIKVRIRRVSDNEHFDWSDNTFKTGSLVVSLLQVMVEVDPIRSPGEYRLDKAGHVRGFDTSSIMNPNADDIYRITVVQDSGTSASNVPQVGELHVGHYVDYIDDNISSKSEPGDDMNLTSTAINNVVDGVWDEQTSEHIAGGSFGLEVQSHATPTEVRTQIDQALIDLGLDHLIQNDTGGTPANSGTYIREIIDKLNLIVANVDYYAIGQGYSYNPQNDTLTGLVWVEHNNMIINTTSDAEITFFDADGNTLFTVGDTTPDVQGVFKIDKLSPGFQKNVSLYAKTSIDVAGIGIITSIKYAGTVG